MIDNLTRSRHVIAWAMPRRMVMGLDTAYKGNYGLYCTCVVRNESKDSKGCCHDTVDRYKWVGGYSQGALRTRVP